MKTSLECIKTGCNILIVQHNNLAWCDLFALNDSGLYMARVNQSTRNFVQTGDLDDIIEPIAYCTELLYESEDTPYSTFIFKGSYGKIDKPAVRKDKDVSFNYIAEDGTIGEISFNLVSAERGEGLKASYEDADFRDADDNPLDYDKYEDELDNAIQGWYADA